MTLQPGDRVTRGTLTGIVEALAPTSDGEPGCWVDWREDGGLPIPYTRKQGLPAGFATKELQREGDFRSARVMPRNCDLESAVETLREGRVTG